MPPRTGSGAPDRARRAGSQAVKRFFDWAGGFLKDGLRLRPLRVDIRSIILKASAAILFAVWIAGGGMVFLQPAPGNSPLREAYASIAQALPDPLPATAPEGNGAGRTAPSAGFDILMANFMVTSEAGLVALRGYLLTGSDGFKAEWVEAMSRLEAAQTAIEVDSRSWTEGTRLVQLRDMRKAVAALRNEEAVLAGIVATPNRHPGLRLYREDTDRMLAEAQTLLDETLRSVLASNWAGAAAHIDTLARIRGDVRDIRESLVIYLPSGATMPPEALQVEYAAFRRAPAALTALRNKVSPEDQARIETLAQLLGEADTQLQQILALKQTPRWDYADYAFKQKVLPLAERISAIIASWKSAR